MGGDERRSEERSGNERRREDLYLLKCLLAAKADRVPFNSKAAAVVSNSIIFSRYVDKNQFLMFDIHIHDDKLMRDDENEEEGASRAKVSR